MFHIYGLAAFATGLLAYGSTIVVLSKFEMGEMMSAIGKYRATYLPLVPPILVAMVNGAEQINAKYDLSSLHTVLCGGAPLSKEEPLRILLRRVGDTAPREIVGKHGGRIVDPVTGKVLGPNRTGELWLKGPSIMKGSSRPYGLHRRLHRSKLTFAELWRAVESVGDCLSDMGIRKGHVVLLLSPNSILFPVVCLSVMSLGAVITTTNPLNTAAEIAKQIKDSNPVLAFTTSQLLPKIALAREKTEEKVSVFHVYDAVLLFG
ncbi:hypothetical protein Bca52824_012865 [Brassica carinata]|uniref:AMP-dependent synthetase/ligase domain-containing protein n=1 Tax=Brassica carinata TaxID=52824 RepID=A0A8X7VYG9_BRACI|nr:hypothetical protein Bca52824_012865 [Brassica carinata]